ncbi:hypothetical protein CVT24_006065 [Panaeolus cyanescens]|uniref:Uncharacterized protein n=1 Tax=Panaeolus cyanescens TaxID=181874 RepID=A0A409VAS6_9AGAR|nr:hypothetical protein CVT24_006065 [Panaeolus cyanescens]
MSAPSFSSFPDFNVQASSSRSDRDSDRTHTHHSRKKERRKHSKERSEKRSKKDRKDADKSRKPTKHGDPIDNGSTPNVHEEETLNRYFYSDRRGDFLNIQYGGLHVGDVPKYHLVDRGRHVLGLPLSLVVHRRSGKAIDIAPKNYRKLPSITDSSAKSLLAAAPTHSLASLQHSNKKYEEVDGVILLPSSRKVKTSDTSHRGILTRGDREGSLSEDSESEQSSSGDEDLERPVLTSHQTKIKQFEEELKEDPSSADLWLSYLSQSLSVVPINSKNSLRARSEISVSILGRSLEVHPNNARNKVLRLAYLKAGEHIWPSTKLEEEWNTALKAGGTDVEFEWLEWKIRKNRSGVEGILEDAESMMKRLPDGEEGEISKLRIFWRVAVAIRNAGFTERATAMFQAQAELTFNCPSELSAKPLHLRLSQLEEFWDSEYPRVGEKGAKGWSTWHISKASVPPAPSPNTIPEFQDLDPYRQWSRNELALDRATWLPSRVDPDNLDPFATVLFSDLRSLLFNIQSAQGKQAFRLVWLSFLGLHIPGLSLCSTRETDWDDRWDLNHFMSPAFMDLIFPSVGRQARITADAVAGVLIGRERQYASSFAPIRSWGSGIRPYFDVSSSEQDPTYRRGLWTAHDVEAVDETMVKELFSQLRRGKGDEVWDTLAVVYEMALNPKSAIKLSKSLLAVNSDSLIHWDTHAQLERFRGRHDEARKIYTTILVQSTQRNMVLSAGRLWWNWAEMEWLAGGDEQALKIILKSAGIEQSPSPMAILRGDRALQDLIQRANDDWKAQEPWLNLRALLKLITTSNAEGAIEIFNDASVHQHSDPKQEALMTSSLLMLYHYSVTLKNPMPPSILRERARTSLERYPDNTIILAVFLEGEKGQGVWGRMRAMLGDNERKGKSVSRRITEVWIAGWDKTRWMSEIERTRAGLSVAVDHERTRGSAVIWRIYIELEIRLNELERAKGLLYRAIAECPLVKELYLLAFGPLRGVFQAAELHRLADSMIERGLRLRRGLEEVVDYIPMEVEEDKDENEGIDEIEARAKEYRRLLPYYNFHSLSNSTPQATTMSPIPAPTIILPREKWPDADFDLPEGAHIINAQHDKEDEEDNEDWDMEMNLGETGKARLSLSPPRKVPLPSSSPMLQQPVIIRPPIQLSDLDDDEDDEGVSTIKASAPLHTVYAKASTKPLVEPIDEDFEEGLALPSDLTQLSLAPLSLQHRASKSSLEWGDKDASCSSQSSDAYSSLGFADASPSSNSATSASLPDTETEEDEDQLDGLVLPTSLFESHQSARQLKKILEMKKKTHYTPAISKPSRVNPDEDFEMGLIINDDVDLSPSRLVSSTHNQSLRNSGGTSRSSTNSLPPQRSSSLRPPSRLKTERAKSPTNPPTSSAKQLQKLRLSPSPPLRPPSRSQNFQALVSNFPVPSPPPVPNNFLASKPGSLRGQKSHSGLKPPTPPSSARKLTRKASLSSLIESNHAQATGSSFPSVGEPSKPARYEETTAASRAKTHKSSSSRIPDFKVPPTRPHTPSSNPIALRLTMPTQSRIKSRPALSQVFGSKETASESPIARATSPNPPRPPSSTSLRGSASSKGSTSPVAPKVLRKPKRQRTYGDGTELDGFDDLPTDRDKEVRYRVQPKGYGNRVPGSSFSSKEKEKEKSPDYGTIRRKDSSLAPPTNTLRRTTTRIDLSQKATVSVHTYAEAPLPKKKKSVSSPTNPTHTRRKPTLIRNLGGTNAPKVVGDMKWNPQTLRWEGNDHVLRDFDAAFGTSSRPALITHLSGSVIGSPVGSFSSGARKVGNMLFDPQRMCWISTLPPEEDEPDVFANLADDEEETWRSKEGTIRANVPRISDASSVGSTTSNTRADVSSPTRSHSRSISESGSDRGSRASMVVGDVDDEFLARCREAEERHRTEMKGWKTSLTKRDASLASDRSFLYEIRALATRKY